jgi:hypothetical protein
MQGEDGYFASGSARQVIREKTIGEEGNLEFCAILWGAATFFSILHLFI